MDADNPKGPSTVSVDAALLNRALVALELADELISVVRLVDWWAQYDRPSVDALLAKARALIVMGQVDRSWQILRDISSNHPDRVDIKLLMARMFIERGWGARATRLIEEIPDLKSDDPRVRLLKDQMQKPISEVPANAGEVARNGSEIERLALAKQYLLSGNQIRARTLLERLRLEKVQPKVVERLLFGIQGDVDDSVKTQSDMLMELLGWSKHSLTKIDSLDLEIITDLGEVDSETAEVSKSSMLAVSGERAAFPALFRSLPESNEFEHGDQESTQASLVADLDAGFDPPTEEVLLGEVQDTQIMEVIGAGESMKVQPATLSFASSAEAKSNNLKEWEAPQTTDEVDEEDDEVIVMASPNQLEEGIESSDLARGPIEVLEKFPTPPKPLRAPSKIETIELPAYGGQLDEPTVELESWDEEVDDYIRQRRNRHFQNLSLLILLCLIGWIVWRQVLPENISNVESGKVVESTAKQLIMAGDIGRMQDESIRIAQVIRENETLTGSLAVDWALLVSFRHSDWVGSMADAALVEELAELARVSGSKSTELALLNANLLWRNGELDRAATSLDEAGIGAFQDYLRLRITLEQSVDPAPEMGLFSEMKSPLLIAVALHRPAVFEPLELSALLDDGLASMEHPHTRLRSNYLVARARLAFSRAEVDQGWMDEAFEIDPNNAEVRLLMGELAWVNGRMEEAAAHFEACLGARSADARCVRAAVITAYEMDRVDDAHWALRHWPSGRMVDEDIQCILTDLNQKAHCDSDTLTTVNGSFVLNLLRLQRGEDPLRQVDLENQISSLQDDFSPMQQALLERASILTAMAAGETIQKDSLYKNDPWVDLARIRHEGVANNRSFGESGGMARQKVARAMFEYAGLIQARYPERAAEVYERYLDLLPSGPRAETVKQGRR